MKIFKIFSLQKGVFLFIFFLLLTIPLTVFLALRQQEIRKKAAEQQVATPEIPPKPEYVPGEVLVKLRSKIPEASLEQKALAFSTLEAKNLPPVINQLNEKYQIKEIEKVFKGAGEPKTEVAAFKAKFPERAAQLKKEAETIDLSRTYRLTFEKETPVEQVIQELSQSPEIEYAEPNYIFRTQLVPNDPYYLDHYPDNVGNRDPNWNPPYDYQWNLKKINMEEAWEITTGSENVIVAVVDTGVDCIHPELTGQCIAGYDFVNDDNDPVDDAGHGTHVAGIIGSLTNNQKGTAGMAFLAKVLPVKVLDEEGSGYNDWVANGIVFAADQGAKVVNLSLGSTTPYPYPPETLKNALDYALSRNVVVIAAAGNSSDDVSKGYWPANYRDIISVGASSEQDTLLAFSNYGNISVVAPGGESSCKPAGQNKTSDPCYNILSLKVSSYLASDPRIIGPEGEKDYLRLAGTSMAAPHVSGLAALVLAKNPSLTNLEIKSLLEFSAEDLGPTDYDDSYGWGKIDASRTLNNIFNNILPPVAEIYSPSRNERISGVYQIIGTAWANNFQSFNLQVGLGKNPSSWNSNGIALTNDGNVSIQDDLLGTLDTSIYLHQPLTIKLEVVDQKGLRKQKYILVYVTEPPPPMGENIRVNDSSAPAVIPSGVFDQEGNYYVVWTDYRNDPDYTLGFSEIYFSKSIDRGLTFGPNKLVTSSEENQKRAFYPSIISKDNVIYVVFENQPYPQGGLSQIVIKKSTDQGATFSTVNTLTIPEMSTPNLPGRFLEVKTDIYNHYLYLTWQAAKISRNNLYIYFARFNLKTNDFEETKILEDITRNDRGLPPHPSIAVDKSGTIHLIWSQENETGWYKIFHVKSEDNGQTFSDPREIIGNEQETQWLPFLAIDTDRDSLYLSFAAQTPTDWARDVWITKSTDSGQTFTSPYNLTHGRWSNPLRAAFYQSPVHVDSSGKVFLGWFDVGNDEVYVVIGDTALMSFTEPILISPYGSVSAPSLKISFVSTGTEEMFTLYDFKIQILSRRIGEISSTSPTPSPSPTPSYPPLPFPRTCPNATPWFSVYYGYAYIDNQPAPLNTEVWAVNPRGEIVGCQTVSRPDYPGLYPFMHVYGEDSAPPPIPGMREGEPVTFYVNDRLASTDPTPVIWRGDRDTHQVNLYVNSLLPTPTLTPTPPIGGPTEIPTLPPTPTPTPVPTETPSPTPLPTPTPTETPLPTATLTPSLTPIPCPRGESGNLDCSLDGCIYTADFELFRQDFGKLVSELNIPVDHHTPDLVVDQNNRIDTADYEILRANFGTCSPGFTVGQ